MEEKVARPRRPYRDDKTKKILVPFESRLIPSLRDPTRPRVPSYSSLPVLSLSLSLLSGQIFNAENKPCTRGQMKNYD